MTTIRQAQHGVELFHLKHGFKTGLLKHLLDDQLPEGTQAWTQDWLTAGIQRSHMIVQEASELMEAWHDADPVAIADAIGDLLYVVLGSAVAAGIDIEPVFDDIQRSNMTKSRNEDRSSSLHPKGVSYSPPDLRPILTRQFMALLDTEFALLTEAGRKLFLTRVALMMEKKR